MDIARVYRLRAAAGAGVVLQTDASLEGLGGVLFLHGHPAAFFTAPLILAADADDTTAAFVTSVRAWLQLASDAPLEPGMVPSLEFLTVLLGVRMWNDRIRPASATRVQVAVRTDSAAAMGAALTWRSPSPRLNEVAKELAADAAAGLWMLDVVEHVPGIANVWADQLSHLSVPEELTIAKAAQEWPPTLQEEFWLTRRKPPKLRAVLTKASHVGTPAGASPSVQ